MRRAGGQGRAPRSGRLPPFGYPQSFLSTVPAGFPTRLPASPTSGARGGPGWGEWPQSPAVPPLTRTYLCRGPGRRGDRKGRAQWAPPLAEGRGQIRGNSTQQGLGMAGLAGPRWGPSPQPSQLPLPCTTVPLGSQAQVPASTHHYTLKAVTAGCY